jgi:hypothetical protein
VDGGTFVAVVADGAADGEVMVSVVVVVAGGGKIKKLAVIHRKVEI